MSAVVDELRAVLAPRIALPSAPGRTRRLFSTVLVPDAKAANTTTAAGGDHRPAAPPKERD
jgi:hypothetical protein